MEHYLEEARERLQALSARAHDAPPDLAPLLAEVSESLGTALEELQVSEEELRLQNDELIAARVVIEEERERYLDLFDFAPDAYLVTDPAGVILEANTAAARILGESRGKLVGRPLTRHLGKDDRVALLRLLEELPQSGEAHEVQLRLQPREGEAFPAALSAAVVRDPRGQVTGIRWLLRDVSEHYRLQQQVTESARILDGLMRYSHDGLVLLDPEFSFVRVNEAYARSCGKQVEDFPGHNHFDWYPSEEVEAAFRRVVETHEPWSVEARPFSFPDHPEWGTSYWDLTLTALPDEEGHTQYLVFTLQDVSERVKNQQELDQYREHLEVLVSERTAQLRESEQNYRTVAEYTYDWEFWMRPDGSFAYMSPSAERITGYPAQSFELDPDLYHMIVHPDDLEVMLAHEREAMETEAPLAFEYRIVSQSGETRWIEHICQAVYDHEGNFAGRRGSNRDVTERKQSEQERARLTHDLEAQRALFAAALEQAPGGGHRGRGAQRQADRQQS